MTKQQDVKSGKVSMSSKNNNHLYSDKWTRLDTLLGEISFLGQLMRARTDYEQEFQDVDIDKFLAWLYNTYGVAVALKDGNLTSEYEVHDEQKFLVFTLKYA